LGGFISCLTPPTDDLNHNSHSRDVIGAEAWQNRDAWGRDEWNTWETWGWYRQFVRAVSGTATFFSSSLLLLSLLLGYHSVGKLFNSHTLTLVCTISAQVHEYFGDCVLCAAQWNGWTSREPSEEVMVCCHRARIIFVAVPIIQLFVALYCVSIHFGHLELAC